MNKLIKKLLSKKFTILLIVLAIIGFVLLVWHFIPQSEESKQNSKAVVMRCGYTELLADGKDVINIRPDTAYFEAAWMNHLTTIPACFGQIIAGNDTKMSKYDISSDSLHKWVEIRLDSMQHHLDSIKTVENELGYYLRVHDVQDEGFIMVSSFAVHIQNRIDTLSNRINALKKIKKGQKLSFRRRTKYYVYYKDDSLNVQYKVCHPTKQSKDGKYQYYQTEDSRTPSGVTVLRKKKYFEELKDIDFINTYGAIAQKAVLRIRKFFDIPINKGHKDDNGIFRKINGHIVSGRYNADTLISGIRFDSTGVYIGEMNSKAEANGKGKFIGRDPSYYEGFWKNNMRENFGFSIAPNKPLRTGEWKEDRYKGERVNYTTNRIYGIDVSRHQHEFKVGRRRKKIYPIEWNKIRITGLGKISKKKISGVVDYPISFVYIKSTEGTTVYNKYYASDYHSARANNIVTGAYHFFSTTSKASKQAEFFIKKTRFNTGDLPPVLDVEPSYDQIKKMGGIDELWNRVRVWMHIVEKRTGRKPVLYISQNFVNKYLSRAPDIKRDYKVWIARYGEYKPDVHMSYWQLAPDGSVRGIRGEVDINVFNGYQTEFLDFKKNECLP